MQPLPTTNLMCLYGLHERYLNNLVSRYDEGLVSDLYRCVILQYKLITDLYRCVIVVIASF